MWSSGQRGPEGQAGVGEEDVPEQDVLLGRAWMKMFGNRGQQPLMESHLEVNCGVCVGDVS